MGGRILSVTGTGTTGAEARTNAYRAVDLVSFEGARFRRDIAAAVDG
jgi:phosphoribosylamine--glycine ligase